MYAELLSFTCSVSLRFVKVQEFTCLSSKATLFYFYETGYMFRQEKLWRYITQKWTILTYVVRIITCVLGYNVKSIGLRLFPIKD
jgi:hypothetical protein